MPKSLITKSKPRPKSTARKPFREVSNTVKTSSTSIANKLKLPAVKCEEDEDGNDALDRLLQIHSDISSIIHQLDEVVAQALKFPSNKGMDEVESFANALSEMQTFLKPWIPRFEKVLSTEPVASRDVATVNKDMSPVVESPQQTKEDSLVSPSPLVYWRAGCTTAGGRQLFLLTHFQ